MHVRNLYYARDEARYQLNIANISYSACI